MKPLPFLFTLALTATLFAAEDPTRISPAMGNVLKAQLAEFRALEIKGLVTAAPTGGVAVVQTGGDSTLRVARKGTTLPLSAAGVPFPVKVVDVTDNGVTVAAETLDSSWTIPVAFARNGSGESRNAATGTLAYVELEGLSLRQSLRLLADQTDRNFVCSDQAANVAVSIFLRDTPIDKVVDELCKSHRLWYRHDELSGVTRIVTMEEFKDTLSGYQQEEMIETFTLLYPNVTEVASIIQGIYADRVRLTLGDEDILDDELSDLSRRFEKFQAIADTGSSSDLMGNFNSSSSYRSTIGNSRRGGVYSTSGGTWLNRDNIRREAEERREGRRLDNFKTDDATKVQALIDGGASNTTVAAAIADSRYQPPSVFVTVARRSNILVVRTGDPRIMDDIRKLVKRVDVPTPMVLLEVKVMELSLDDSLDLSFKYSANSSLDFIGDGIANAVDYATDAAGNVVESVTPHDYEETGYRRAAAGLGGLGIHGLSEADRLTDSTDGMSFQIVNRYFSARINLLQQKGKVRTIATPTLLTAHNEISQLFIGKEVPIVRNVTAQTIISEQGSSVTVPQTEMELRKVGTRLLITPNINADRTVTLRLMQENSALSADKSSVPVVITTDSGSDVKYYDVDVVESRSIAGTFVAQDKMAIAAGGLINESVGESRSGVPWLMDVPYLGVLFRTTQKVKSRTEMIIIIKPHVLSTPGESRAVTTRFVDDNVKHPDADAYRSREGLKREKKDRDAFFNPSL